MVVLQEFKSALLRGLNDRIKHQFRVRLGMVFSNFVGVVLMEQVFVPVAEFDETGNPFMFSMVSNNLLDDCISVLLIQFAKSLGFDFVRFNQNTVEIKDNRIITEMRHLLGFRVLRFFGSFLNLFDQLQKPLAEINVHWRNVLATELGLIGIGGADIVAFVIGFNELDRVGLS